jgi:hypothetical protein
MELASPEPINYLSRYQETRDSIMMIDFRLSRRFVVDAESALYGCEQCYRSLELYYDKLLLFIYLNIHLWFI